MEVVAPTQLQTARVHRVLQRREEAEVERHKVGRDMLRAVRGEPTGLVHHRACEFVGMFRSEFQISLIEQLIVAEGQEGGRAGT